ncbi:MAG: hypothetical protein ACRELE_05110 [Gemmatimonadales bacterium]
MTPRSDQARRLGWGAACTALATVLAALIWGGSAMVAAVVFGATATGLQMLAASAMARTGVQASLDHLRVYAIGVVLRLSGVVFLGIAVTLDRATFAPLPSALGYVGTVLPLLYLETRLAP